MHFIYKRSVDLHHILSVNVSFFFVFIYRCQEEVLIQSLFVFLFNVMRQTYYNQLHKTNHEEAKPLHQELEHLICLNILD